MASVFSNFKHKQLSTDLRAGAIGILPTDTLYGVVCLATSQTAVERLYALKARQKKPGTIIASSIDQLVELGIKRRYLRNIADYWPGPVSVVVPTDNPALTYLDQGKGSLAVRVVADTDLVELLHSVGPLLTSSANMPGLPPANNIDQAKESFGERVDFYVDGGDYSGRQPSTLIQVIDDTVDVLRHGSGKIDA